MYTFDSRIRYSEMDSEGRLTLPALLNYFQDVTTFQSEDLGVGIQYTRELHLGWVLSAWQIVVDRYPSLYEKVTIGTLPYEFKSFMGSRNFVMMDEKGDYIAKANSLWTLLDTNSGKPSKPTELMLEKYPLEEKIPMDYAPRKITIPAEGRTESPLMVKKHHLDTNHHVNNGQYISMAMEYIPEHFIIRQMRAEYKKQAFLEDVLHPYIAEIEGGYVIVFKDEEDKPYVIVEFLGK